MDRDYLNWPFFDARHGELARALDVWAAANLNETSSLAAASTRAAAR